MLSGTDLRHVLVVPIDFAKKTHVAQIARGTGEYLRKRPLNVRNTAEGSRFLLDKIDSCRNRYRVPKRNVVIGGEDPPEYVSNFVAGIRAAGYHFVRVNAKEAKKHRATTRATSDAIALDGIAQAMLLRRAYDIQSHDEIYGAMKMASRNRRKLKKQETALKNRIHRNVEVLLPGFLSETESGLLPFGQGSLDLMEKGCSVVRVRRMREDALAKRLKKLRVHNPAAAAAKLKSLAEAALPPEPSIVPYLEKSLGAKVRLLRAIRENIRLEENEMARCLAQTPGFLLTSIPGLGIVLSGGLVAEYGCTDDWRHPDSMASYGGIVPRTHQTGGPESEAVAGRLPIDSNHHLKDQLLQAAFQTGHNTHPAWRRLGLPGEHPLFEHYRDIELREGRSRLGTAKKLLKVICAMTREHQVYLPHNALDPGDSDAMEGRRFIEYLEIVGEMLRTKWKGYDLSGIPEERNQLANWLKEIDELSKYYHRTNR